jgi:hypothetical protein
MEPKGSSPSQNITIRLHPDSFHTSSYLRNLFLQDLFQYYPLNITPTSHQVVCFHKTFQQYLLRILTLDKQYKLCGLCYTRLSNPIISSLLCLQFSYPLNFCSFLTERERDQISHTLK